MPVNTLLFMLIAQKLQYNISYFYTSLADNLLNILPVHNGMIEGFMPGIPISPKNRPTQT
jgi:hypothetical protein